MLNLRAKLKEITEEEDTVWLIEKRGEPVGVLLPFPLMDKFSPALKEEIYKKELQELNIKYKKGKE